MTTTTAKLTPEIMSDLLAEIECDESERVYFLRKQLEAAHERAEAAERAVDELREELASAETDMAEVGADMGIVDASGAWVPYAARRPRCYCCASVNCVGAGSATEMCPHEAP